jgi:hypothetical protein
MLLYVALAIGSALFALAGLHRLRVRSARRTGLYPRGSGSMPHILNLVASGDRALAVRLYRELHQVSLSEAHAAVERLAKRSGLER